MVGLSHSFFDEFVLLSQLSLEYIRIASSALNTSPTFSWSFMHLSFIFKT